MNPQIVRSLGVLWLLILLALSPTTFVRVNAYSLGEYCTCRGVQNETPWGYIGKTSEFTTRDTMVFVWLILHNVDKAYQMGFRWFMIKDFGNTTKHIHSWEINSEKGSYSSWTTWDYIPISTLDSEGRWGVSVQVDSKRVFELQFTVKKDPYLIQKTETKTETLSAWTTVTAASTTIATATTTRYSLISVLSFPLDSIVLLSLIAFSSYSAYKWTRARAIASRKGEAFVEYLARLEDMKSGNRISQTTYERLKEEYWTRMRESTNA